MQIGIFRGKEGRPGYDNPGHGLPNNVRVLSQIVHLVTREQEGN